MWISAQYKNILKDCNCLVVGFKNPKGIYEVINENINILLGEYETEKRAKEVLHQIRRQIETNISADTVIRGVKTVSETVFQMPRE